MTDPVRNTKAGYDRVAAAYASRFQNELDYKPFDRQMLRLLADRVAAEVGGGPICDLGCGPGHVAAYLASIGAEATGIDLSDGMIEAAAALYPSVPYSAGDMLDLAGVPDGAFAGIAAFYSIIHVPRERIREAIAEMRRVLRPGGSLLLTFHIGTETKHLDEWFEQPVDLDFHFLEVAPITEQLSEAGFRVAEIIQRSPYPDEVETTRAYLFARRPEA